jgi:ATP-dependent helicase/nuclease subunit B
MIQIIYHSSPEDKSAFFKSATSTNVDAFKDIWLVSHLEAKQILQAELLKVHPLLPSRAIQRASEYWNWLFLVNCPEWTVVSESLIFTWIEEWFALESIDTRYKDISLFYNFFEQFLPILSRDEGSESRELFKEWLFSDPSRRERLEGWFEQCEKFWNLLNERRSLPRPWLLSILLKKETLHFGEVREFYVDLGSDIQQQEVEFLIKMGESHSVNVLVPQSHWSEEYKTLLSVYRKITESENPSVHLASSAKPILPELADFSSVVREVKGAVTQVREWLNSGVPATDIGILSPNIEEYWDLLREHLIIEGVATNKRYMGKVISLPFVQAWLSRLHLRQKEIVQSDLETYLFGLYQNQNGSTLSYADFKKNFSHLYEEEGLRGQLRLPEEIKTSQRLTLQQFIDLLYLDWPIENKKIIDGLADQFIQDLSLSQEWNLSLWLKFLELTLTRSEWPVVEGDEGGVCISHLSHTDWRELSHCLILGCTQSYLREQLKSPAQAQDIFSIENDLGIVLNRAEQTKKEFDLRWFLEKSLKSCILTCSETDFEGQPQTASSHWLRLHKKHQHRLLESNTRWDQLMRDDFLSLDKELGLSEAESPVIAHKLDLEQSLADYQNIQLKKKPSLSASSLSKLDECGFKFYANKILKLKEPKVYDLEIDSMYQGQLLHAILEEIGKRGNDLDFSREELLSIYDGAVEAVASEVAAQPFWKLEKERHFQFVVNFLELEKAWRQQFPHTKIIATEAPFEGFVGVVDDKLLFSKEQNHSSQFPLKGKIDRVDQDSSGNIGLTDYKTSKGANLKSLPNWAKNGQFQMPIYAWSVENGLAEGIPAREAVVANYIFLKEKIKGSGFALKDHVQELADTSGKSKENVSREDKEKYFSEISDVMVDALDRIAQGNFPALPKSFDVCETCDWRTLCRAPHLR